MAAVTKPELRAHHRTRWARYTAADLNFQQASGWVSGCAPMVPAGGPVLDVACGTGRHTRFWLARDRQVVALDRDLSGIADLVDHPRLEAREVDLEAGQFPTFDRRFAAVIVTNYLHRPLFPALVSVIDDGGVLIYETFAVGNELFGSPSRPDFLLRPGELLEAVRGQLRVLAFEDLTIDVPRPAAVQRIVALREADGRSRRP